MRLKIGAALCILFTTTNVGATLTFSSVTGGSNAIRSGTAVTVYGGLAGPACSTGAVCNSCSSTTPCTNTSGQDQTPLCTCNEVRVVDGMLVTINFTKAAGDGNGNGMWTGSSTGGSSVPNSGRSPSKTSVTLSWADICSQMTTPGSCVGQPTGSTATISVSLDGATGTGTGTGGTTTSTAGFSVTFKLIDPQLDENVYGAPNAEGVGAFVPFPGDGRAYITNINTPSGFPALVSESSEVVAVRVMASPISMDQANVREAVATADLPVTEAGSSLGSMILEGLENNKLYFIRVAVLDQAHNVIQYFPDQVGLPTSCTSAPDASCPYSVTPDQVLGMLTKDFNCFIATAAYGSSLEPKLQVFRDFRYKILLRHAWGKRFVFSYYKYGPYAARYIVDSPILRAVARGALWPLYGWSWLALEIGFGPTLALSALLLAALGGLMWLVSRRTGARA